MENVPCEVFMNEVEIETNLIEEENLGHNWISDRNSNNLFSLDGIVTNLRTCCLQTYNLERLIFVSKNWPNNLKISPFGQFGQAYRRWCRVTRGIEGVETSFDRDEIVDM
jgi:hypothetical protein